MPTSPAPFAVRAFRFACAIVRFDVELRTSHRVPQHIARQLLASGTSIGANLEEAKAGQSRQDVTAKFAVALKEARETHYWLRLLVATDLVEAASVAQLNSEASELVAILTVSLRRLRQQPPRGVSRTRETSAPE